MIAAKGLPIGLGDMDASLYLLFKEIRERSTVALSGEAADEVFGGHPWFHMPEVQQADAFPWLAAFMSASAPASDPMQFLAPDARRAGEEPISVHSGSAVWSRPPAAGQGDPGRSGQRRVHPFDRNWVTEITQADPAAISMQTRHGLERVLDLATWLDIHRPELRLC